MTPIGRRSVPPFDNGVRHSASDNFPTNAAKPAAPSSMRSASNSARRPTEPPIGEWQSFITYHLNRVFAVGAADAPDPLRAIRRDTQKQHVRPGADAPAHSVEVGDAGAAAHALDPNGLDTRNLRREVSFRDNHFRGE